MVSNEVPLTPDQLDQYQTLIDLHNIQTKIDSATADVIAINGDNTVTPPTAGFKDQINGNPNTVPPTVGLKDQLLTTSGWNALTNAAKLDLLRTVLLATLTLMVQWMTVCVDITKSVKFLLKETKHNLNG
jgi:hypothetical protein